ncbi:MAG: DUF503 domain-containing protein [Clostridia bacterium]|nr:DUF503 domain-containing protein [Clostridia bacterium]
MKMVVLGVCTVEVHIPCSNSLKNKRGILKSIIQRMRNKFNVSVCELEKQDLWQMAVLGIACISTDKNVLYRTFNEIEKFIENFGEVRITKVNLEII